MANLTITAADVAPVKVIEQITGPAAAAITAGQAVYLVAATGQFALADEDATAPADAVLGVAIGNANQARMEITVVLDGWLDLGTAPLADMDFGAAVFLSDTAGALADADPGNGIIIGHVVPGWGSTSADRLLRVKVVPAVVLEVGS
jgi:hypothetical protein